MKIEKAKLNKALKQIGIFIKKNSTDRNASLVHFHNEAGKATIFATDLASAGRVHFDTEEQGVFDFCVEYAQLAQTTRVRGKEINAEITKEDSFDNDAVVFSDAATRFVCALRDVNEIAEIEAKAVVPDFPPLEIDAKTLKIGLKEGGYARNEKDVQKDFAQGINISSDGSVVEIASLDNKRIACWRKQLPDGVAAPKMSGMLGNRAIQAIGLFDDGENIRVYVDENKFVIVSDTYEAYTTKIQCRFPDFKPFFEKPLVSAYEVKNADVSESLSIAISDPATDIVELSLHQDSVDLAVTGKIGEKVEDRFTCKRISGGDEKILLAAHYFSDVLHFISREKIVFEFRDMNNDMKMFCYQTGDGALGLIAPRQK